MNPSPRRSCRQFETSSALSSTMALRTLNSSPFNSSSCFLKKGTPTPVSRLKTGGRSGLRRDVFSRSELESLATCRKSQFTWVAQKCPDERCLKSLGVMLSPTRRCAETRKNKGSTKDGRFFSNRLEHQLPFRLTKTPSRISNTLCSAWPKGIPLIFQVDRTSGYPRRRWRCCLRSRNALPSFLIRSLFDLLRVDTFRSLPTITPLEKVLHRVNIKKIVTTCPHCFNTLKNEYPQFGGNYEVVHHTDYILNLIEDGKIRLSKKINAKITFHDSCYLGRYNDIYESPRQIMSSIPGTKTIEMERSKDKGFCCGAGGARMFMEETIGKRVNHDRTEEALALNINVIGTACPFCLTMLSDGVKDKEATEKVVVKDIAELVAEAI